MTKRILCVVSSLNAGGAETFLMKVFRTIDRSKYVFDFIVNSKGIYDEEVIALGGKIYTVSLRTKSPLKAYSEIKQIVSQNKYEYFFKLTDTPIGGFLDVLAAKMGGAKHISVRSCNAIVNAPFYKELICTCLRPVFNALIDCKIAPSDLAAKYTFGQRQVKKGNVHYINNGVDLRIFKYDEASRDSIREEFSLPEDAFLVGHIGRFNKQKNHEYLIQVFEKIHQKNPNAYLLLVGIGELQDDIKEIVNNSAFKDNVIFAGLRKDVPKLLSAMDILLLPSFYEGMPNVVIEAQATGLSCYISDTITKEANITGLVHYLSINIDPEIWASEIQKGDFTQRKNTQKDFVKANYDIETVSNNLIKLLFKET